MIIDCHYHLDSRVQPLENLLAKMEENGIAKTAIMPSMCDPIPHPPEYLLKVMRFLLTHPYLYGISKKLAPRFTPDGDLNMPKGVLKIYKDPDNASVAKVLSAYPDKFMGWIFVNPKGENDPVGQVSKWQRHGGFIGVKAHPYWHQYPPERLMPAAQKAVELGMPLLIHTGFDDHGDFIPLIENLSNLKLVLAHVGFPRFSHTWKAIKKYPNILIDLSADAYVNAKSTRDVVEFLGADRCLFGTDGPYGEAAADGWFDNGKIKRRIETLFGKESIRRKILGENFCKLIA